MKRWKVILIVYLIGAIITAVWNVQLSMEDFDRNYPNLKGRQRISELSGTAYFAGSAWPITLPVTMAKVYHDKGIK